MEFLHPENQTGLTVPGPQLLPRRRKDTGQRRECGCDVAKDIGQYTTCMHLCCYCYANRSDAEVRNNYQRFLRHRDSGEYGDTIIPDRE